ncbi:MAG: hypothetical protein LLG06_09070 [Desulfobacteraceae bacterium]|nr:hypothetical protein [Desulfobacteraceae bacterium]
MNLKGFQGKVSKPATIVSNDPHSPEVTVKVEGNVQALIDLKPTTNVVFRGMSERLQETVLDLVGAVPFQISNSECSINDNIAYSVETIEDGRHYRLKVANKTKRGNYAGYIKLMTDLAQKPDILVRVNGYIEGEIAVKPQTILIGKLSANQPERTCKIVVTSNRNHPFQITKLTYDKRFVDVEQSPLEKNAGYSLNVSPKLGGVPVGQRKQTTIAIETDATPGEKDEVQVHLFNSADQPTSDSK